MVHLVPRRGFEGTGGIQNVPQGMRSKRTSRDTGEPEGGRENEKWSLSLHRTLKVAVRRRVATTIILCDQDEDRSADRLVGGKMREMSTEATMPETASVVALLSGRRDVDEVTIAALRLVEPHVFCSDDVGQVLAAVRSGTNLVICDGDNAGFDLAKISQYLDGHPRTTLLVLLGEGESPESRYGPDTTPIDHFLCRPYREETLAALCRLLLEHGRAPVQHAAGAPPPLRIRQPARFSTRPLYGEAARFVGSVFESVQMGGGPDVDGARVLAERLQTSLMQSNQLLLRALEPYDRFELGTHCVNVAVVAGKIAIGMELSLGDTHRAIHAGLLHDIGMARLPLPILEKEGPLTDEEREEIRRHPGYGADLLAGSAAETEWLSVAVRQEHERMDGSGYPSGARGSEIDLLARILGVADVFEAFSHARFYRSPFTAFEALEKVVAMRGEQFDAAIVDALASEVSVFPLDSYVQLSTGDIARVIGTNPENLMRPIVEVLWNGSWEPLSPPDRLDLAATTEISISQPLHETEVPIT